MGKDWFKKPFLIVLMYRTLLSYPQCEHLWSLLCFLSGESDTPSESLHLTKKGSVWVGSGQMLNGQTRAVTMMQANGLAAGGYPDHKLGIPTEARKHSCFPHMVYAV